MSNKEIAEELQRYLELYAFTGNDENIIGIVTYASELVGRLTNDKDS